MFMKLSNNLYAVDEEWITRENTQVMNLLTETATLRNQLADAKAALELERKKRAKWEETALRLSHMIDELTALSKKGE